MKNKQKVKQLQNSPVDVYYSSGKHCPYNPLEL